MSDSIKKLKRLQKILSERGVASRRAAELMIEEGRVSVDGRIVKVLGTRVPDNAKISVDGRPVLIQKKRVFLLHKPRGVVTTLSDTHGRDDLRKFLRSVPERLFPVGRLDQDVSGILLLTNDGEFAHQLLHPRHEFERIYLAVVGNVPTSDLSRRAKKGLTLSDGFAAAKSLSVISEDRMTRALLRPVNKGEALVRLVVAEGRNHLVKRFLAALGHPVRLLSRVEFGPFKLGTLKPGELREIKLPKLDLPSDESSLY